MDCEVWLYYRWGTQEDLLQDQRYPEGLARGAFKAGMEHMVQRGYDSATDAGGDSSCMFWKDLLPDFEPKET